jgi:hypothetical protein
VTTAMSVCTFGTYLQIGYEKAGSARLLASLPHLRARDVDAKWQITPRL